MKSRIYGFCLYMAIRLAILPPLYMLLWNLGRDGARPINYAGALLVEIAVQSLAATIVGCVYILTVLLRVSDRKTAE